MSKSSNVYARIEPDLKEKAEAILSSLGIPASNAITMFYRQIVLNNGLPFELKIPEHRLDVSKMSEKELDNELEKGYSDFTAGKTVSAETAFSEIRKELNL